MPPSQRSPQSSLPSLIFLCLALFGLLVESSAAVSDPGSSSRIEAGPPVLISNPYQAGHLKQKSKQELRLPKSTLRGIGEKLKEEERSGVRDFISRQLRSDPSLAVLIELEESAGSHSAQTALSEQSLLQIREAKSRLASRVASYLAQSAEPYNGLSEPSNNCRTRPFSL